MSKKHRIAPVIIEIRPSKMIPGEIGLFAARSLKKNTVIAETKRFEEFFHPWKEFKKIDPITQEKIKQFCIQNEEGFYTPADFNWLPVPWNMNHCCEYNVGFDTHDNFVTTRAVKRGEELYWDYGMGIWYPKFKLTCKCGTRTCRKVITGNDWKNPVYMKKNKKYFLRRLLKNAKAPNHE